MDLRGQLEARKNSLRATKTIITNETGEQYEIVDGVSRKLNVRVSPFVVDVKPDMQMAKIVDGLYLSSQDPVTSEELLKTHTIRHILSLGVEPFVKYEGIEYDFVDFLDLPEFDISSAIKECLRVIDRCIGDNVLVHCNAGVSRSATIVIAYLMAREGLTFEESYDKVKSARSCIKPNAGFVRQLRIMSRLKDTLKSKPDQ